MAMQDLPRDAGTLDTTPLVSLGAETELLSDQLNLDCIRTCISGWTIRCDGATF
ncbi:hypothetical protein KIK06_07600 [Nocardiopsis sp. EMB25]|uniref:cinnamycin family lantibiotic n=1 Tax=Nocardiopsis sp. EMB25 TaxID=2835867 RepID=UPI002283D21A|nr:cinnamycin family lantibiotic [Nocardiopsis sp. EMB25]MCY9783754.1 hypothetical protein [Nocardiopsis sp. EMB25]